VVKHILKPCTNKGGGFDTSPNKILKISFKFGNVVVDHMLISNQERHNSKNWQWLVLGLTSLLPHFIVGISGFHLFPNFTCVA